VEKDQYRILVGGGGERRDHLRGLAVNWRIIIRFNWLRIRFNGRFL
jgi:hypothetical protein